MAAALAEGQTTLMNAALEPEITDLADLLNKMGAKISGAGTSTITIDGVSSLHGTSHSIIPDRIETGTFLAAGAMTDSDLELTACNPGHLTSVIEKMREAGANIEGGLRQPACPRRPLAAFCGREHARVSRIRHRHAGAIHGTDDPGQRDHPDHRKHF